MTAFFILQLWHEEGAVVLLRHAELCLSSPCPPSFPFTRLLFLSLCCSLFLVSHTHLLFLLLPLCQINLNVSVQVEIIHANQSQWLPSARFTKRTQLQEVTRSQLLLPLYPPPLIAELLVVYTDWKDSIYCNCCLVLLTTFFKGHTFQLSCKER